MVILCVVCGEVELLKMVERGELLKVDQSRDDKIAILPQPTPQHGLT